MVEKDLIKLAVDEIQKVAFDYDEYDENEYIICKILYLSTRPNTHGLVFSEEVLREYASTILGKWIVAEINKSFFVESDFTTHTDAQCIQGIVPKDQEVEFVRAEDGYLDAYVDGVISKRYASDACSIFERDGDKNVSIEFHCARSDNDETIVESFIIRGVTLLGTGISPSVPDANIKITRFSEEDANNFFTKVQSNRLTALERFAEERKEKMAEKQEYVSHPVNTSKKAMYDGEWDGNKAKQDLVKEKNFSTLAPKVCMRLEDGWENREVTKCDYPVMMLHDGEWVYSSKGLTSALSYAKKENETSVITKVEKIRKKLGLSDNTEGKEETAKMSKEIEFAAVDIGDMWSKVWSFIRGRDAWDYCIEGIYEEDNKKFAVLKDGKSVLYRLDFSLTEEGITAADELIEVQKDFIETDKVVRFAEPENIVDYRKFAEEVGEDDDKDEDNCDPEDKAEGDDDCKDGEEKKMSADEIEAEMARLKKDIEDRDNIIMEKDAELEELRTFKKNAEDKEKALAVETVMEEIKGFVDEAKFNEFRNEGMSCEMTDIDAWKNKVKAFCFEEKIVSKTKKRQDVFAFSAPFSDTKITNNSLWN